MVSSRVLSILLLFLAILPFIIRYSPFSEAVFGDDYRSLYCYYSPISHCLSFKEPVFGHFNAHPPLFFIILKPFYHLGFPFKLAAFILLAVLLILAHNEVYLTLRKFFSETYASFLASGILLSVYGKTVYSPFCSISPQAYALLLFLMGISRYYRKERHWEIFLALAALTHFLSGIASFIFVGLVLLLKKRFREAAVFTAIVSVYYLPAAVFLLKGSLSEYLGVAYPSGNKALIWFYTWIFIDKILRFISPFFLFAAFLGILRTSKKFLIQNLEFFLAAVFFLGITQLPILGLSFPGYYRMYAFLPATLLPFFVSGLKALNEREKKILTVLLILWGLAFNWLCGITTKVDTRPIKVVEYLGSRPDIRVFISTTPGLYLPLKLPHSQIANYDLPVSFLIQARRAIFSKNCTAINKLKMIGNFTYFYEELTGEVTCGGKK